MPTDGNDIQVGDKIIGESTSVTLTVKTAMFILTGFIGLLSLLFTWFYIDGRARDKQMKDDMEKFQKELTKDMEQFEKDIKSDIGPLSQNILQIVREQGEILMKMINSFISYLNKFDKDQSNRIDRTKDQ